ncbi:hypothetical protein [Neptunomonas antarctica]|uniref:Uncharacterized protein n=1 Tax=Neptunomonas antarctica TaxID=619304 RepID=A0A1N7J0G6_9GAMM|nr:hypothetical protein [Neptunomonas antarctica]SIS42789.1 hypothetical protein SAMN05421760_101420 [Neptunomonas antarctica]
MLDNTSKKTATNTQANKKLRSDKWLRLFMRVGIPLGVISLASLWLGHLLAHPVFGKLFLVTLPLALIVGFSYNIRYVMLAVREQRKASEINK